MIYHYCSKLRAKLLSQAHNKKKIIHYTSNVQEKRVNAAFLMGAFQIIELKRKAEDAYKTLVGCNIPPYIEFRDASINATYKITILDCLNAIYRAQKLRFFNFTDFDYDEYEFYERVENGDFNWIVPTKFIAFCGPHESTMIDKGYPYHSPEHYFNYFRQHNVSTIVRLNNVQYHSTRFSNAGFQHYDLYFTDGTSPNDNILQKFLLICERTNGVVAVHCKAGLGRTGSLIGAYIIKHYQFTALEAIAWLRLCRPGSVIDEQQQWLIE